MMRKLPRIALLIGALAMAGQASAHGGGWGGPAVLGALVGAAVVGSVVANQPREVYVQQQPVYVQPQPVYYGAYRGHHRQGAWGDADRDGVPNVYDRDSRFYDARAAYRHGGWSDADRDGVPNRYDRAPANPYRR